MNVTPFSHLAAPWPQSALNVGLRVGAFVGLLVGAVVLPHAQHALTTFGSNAPHAGCHALPLLPLREHHCCASYVAHVPNAFAKPGVSVHVRTETDCNRRRPRLAAGCRLHTRAVLVFRQAIRLWNFVLLALISSTETETETAGVSLGSTLADPRASLRLCPVLWSGQHFSCLQHGNIHAISKGTKQQTFEVSDMQGSAHSSRTTKSSSFFLQSSKVVAAAVALPLK